MSVLDKFLDAMKVNDDFDDDEFLDDDFNDDFADEKPKKRFFKKLEEEDDEDDYEPERRSSKKSEKQSAPKAGSTKTSKTVKTTKTASASSKVTPIRNAKKTASATMEVCVIKPTTMEDTREIADTLIDNCTVILNLEGLDMELAQRIIDFTSGACYAIGGSLQKVSSYIFILTPAIVDITGDYQEILNGAFDVPSIRTEY